MLQHPLRHLPRSQDQRPQPAQVAKDRAGQVNRRVGHAHRAAPDAGLGAGALAGGNRRLKGLFADGAGSAGAPRRKEPLAHLSENLRLAHHQAVEAGGHPEEVAQGGQALVMIGVIDVVTKVIAVDGQRFAPRLHQVELGAVAGRDDHRLLRLAPQFFQ